MLKKNQLKIVVSSIIILLPAIYGVIMWNNLPDVMTTHWGASGNANGFSEKGFAVFGLPSFLLVVHFVCLLFTFLDKKQKDQNSKALGMIFWITPLISLLSNGIMYHAAFGKELDPEWFVPAILGAMFIFIGNYLPKTKPNRTLGIKVVWALNNEENWNKTHRLGGKIWVVGGLIILFSIFLPSVAAMWIIGCAFAAMMVIPVAYSYYIYKQHQKEGISYTTPPRSKTEMIAVKITAVIVPVILIGIAVLMFTGKVDVDCEDTSFSIDTTYWTDLKIAYSEIDTIEYRKDLNLGIRTYGFASARLLTGIFQNDEFESYTLYSYTNAKGFIVLTSGAKTLVIGMRDAEDAQAIYQILQEKIIPTF